MYKKLLVIVSAVAVAGLAIAATTAGEGKATVFTQRVLQKNVAGNAKSVAKAARLSEGVSANVGLVKKASEQAPGSAEGYSQSADPLAKQTGAGAAKVVQLSEGYARSVAAVEKSTVARSQGQGDPNYNPVK